MSSSLPRSCLLTFLLLVPLGGRSTFAAVSQAGVSCTYELSPASLSVGPEGPESYWESFSVQTQSDCSWWAVTATSWIHIHIDWDHGQNNGSVIYHVDANPGAGSRTGLISVGGGEPSGFKTFTVHQEGTGVPLRPPAADFDGDGTADWVLYRHGAWLYFGPCGHPLNERGPALDPACSSCVARICSSFTPYCCGQFWDSFCVDAVRYVCQ